MLINTGHTMCSTGGRWQFSFENLPNKMAAMAKNICDALKPVLCDVEEKGACAEKTIICQTYADFNEVSTLIVSELYNRGLVHLLKSVCQMFSASTDKQVKTSILSLSLKVPYESLLQPLHLGWVVMPQMLGESFVVDHLKV